MNQVFLESGRETAHDGRVHFRPNAIFHAVLQGHANGRIFCPKTKSGAHDIGKVVGSKK